MSTDYKFEGWAGFDKDSVKGNLKFIDYEPKKWNEDDIDGEFVPQCRANPSENHVRRNLSF